MEIFDYAMSQIAIAEAEKATEANQGEAGGLLKFSPPEQTDIGKHDQ